MSEETTLPRRMRYWDIPIPLIVGGGLLAILLAVIGWMLALPPEISGVERFSEALYRAVSVNTPSDAYARTVDGPNGELSTSNVFLIIARWLGVMVFFATLAKVVIGLFLESLLSWHCRLTARDHVVIIGDREFAFEAAIAAAERGDKVVHFIPQGRETTRDGILTLDSDIGLQAMLEQAAVHRARSLVFADKDNATAIDMARTAFESAALRSQAGHESLSGGQGPHIFAMVDDGWFEYREELEYQFHKAADASETRNDGVLDSVVELLSESRCAARAVLSSMPLYALQDRGVQHSLLVGFGAMGEAMLTEICESQRVDAERHQAITIIDPDRSTWDRFIQRCPEWQDVFDGQFIHAAMDAQECGQQELLDRMRDIPVTAAYVATGGGVDPAIAAARLKETVMCQFDAEELPASCARFPIFTCVRGGASTFSVSMRETLMPSADSEGLHMPIVAFGSWSDVVAASRILEHEPDATPFMIHRLYSALYGKPVATNWSHVDETSRYSSRSAAAFIPTLIHAAGFDTADWRRAFLPLPPSPNHLPQLGDERPFADEPVERLLLARLEHVRWCAERRLRGFKFDTNRDDKRKRHPSMVSFDALSSKDQKGNLDYIRALSTQLIEQPAATVLTRRSDVRRAPVRPTDLELLKRAGHGKTGEPKQVELMETADAEI